MAGPPDPEMVVAETGTAVAARSGPLDNVGHHEAERPIIHVLESLCPQAAGGRPTTGQALRHLARKVTDTLRGNDGTSDNPCSWAWRTNSFAAPSSGA
jgi:hypothetical protein